MSAGDSPRIVWGVHAGHVADGMVNGAHRRTRIGAAAATTVTKGRWWARGLLSHRAGDLQRRGRCGA